MHYASRVSRTVHLTLISLVDLPELSGGEAEGMPAVCRQDWGHPFDEYGAYRRVYGQFLHFYLRLLY